MKANEAPERIWINSPQDLPCGTVDSNSVEYTRTDVFIEKACNLLARMIWEVTYEDLEGNSTQHYDKMEFVEDFRKYMKGE